MTAPAIQPDPVESALASGLRYVTDAAPGIARKRRGQSFTYLNPDGTSVKDKATLERIRSLVIPPAWENVWICTRPNGHLQATGHDAKGRKQYRYHPDYRAFRNLTKYDKMLVFGKALPRIREAVERDLQLTGIPKERLLAAVVRLLDCTCIRVGNEEYAQTNGSFGLTTLRDDHADINGPHIRFRFRGKSGVERDLNLKDARLAKIIKRSQDLPGEELFQYVDDDGEPHPIDSSDVNDYLRQISGEGVTAKDFRTWHGTRYMLAELAAIGPATSETDAKKRVVTALKSTANHLANRPATCRNYYIHPAVLDVYKADAIPDVFRRAARHTDLPEEEAAVFHIVKTFYEQKR